MNGGAGHTGQAVAAPDRRLRGGWFERRDPARYVLARHWPPRFDLSAAGRFPAANRPLGRARLARQIRQDMWRLFKGLRGFSPVIQVDRTEGHIFVRAGGALLTASPAPGDAEARIETLLNCPVHRARWLTWAARGRG